MSPRKHNLRPSEIDSMVLATLQRLQRERKGDGVLTAALWQALPTGISHRALGEALGRLEDRGLAHRRVWGDPTYGGGGPQDQNPTP
jgi:hypothetical protein